MPPPEVDPDTEPSDLGNAEIVIPSDDEEDNNEGGLGSNCHELLAVIKLQVLKIVDL